MCDLLSRRFLEVLQNCEAAAEPCAPFADGLDVGRKKIAKDIKDAAMKLNELITRAIKVYGLKVDWESSNMCSYMSSEIALNPKITQVITF